MGQVMNDCLWFVASEFLTRARSACCDIGPSEPVPHHQLRYTSPVPRPTSHPRPLVCLACNTQYSAFCTFALLHPRPSAIAGPALALWPLLCRSSVGDTQLVVEID